MRLFGTRAPVVDAVHAQQEKGVADGIGHAAVDHQERHHAAPPEQVLRQIGRVPCEAVGPVRQHAAIGEVGKADAESEGRPGIDRGQEDQHPRPDPQHHLVAVEPVVPLPDIMLVAHHLPVAEDAPDERRIADQRGQPAAEEGVARPDMRIERAQRHDIADRADHHVDEEQQIDQHDRENDRIAEEFIEVGIHHIGEIHRHDGDHEGAEEALDDPGAPVLLHLARIPVVAHEQHRAEMPCVVARVLHHAVEPQDIGHRQHHHGRAHDGEDLERVDVVPAPVPAAQAEQGDQDGPCGPQARDLGQRCLEVCLAGFRERPIDPGGRAPMHLVDEYRPGDHRDGDEYEACDGRIGADHRLARAGQVPEIGDARPVAGDPYPCEQREQPHQPHGWRDVARRTTVRYG